MMKAFKLYQHANKMKLSRNIYRSFHCISRASVAKENYIQQDDNYRDFMNNITDGGLQYAYTAYKGMNSKAFYRQKVADERKKHIIVVGAGMAGLAAAYELAQVGHEVRNMYFISTFYYTCIT